MQHHGTCVACDTLLPTSAALTRDEAVEWLVAEAARPRASAEERARLLAAVRWLGTQSARNVHFLLRASAGAGGGGGSVSGGGGGVGSVGVGIISGGGGVSGGVASDSYSGAAAVEAGGLQWEQCRAEALLRAAYRGEVALYGRRACNRLCRRGYSLVHCTRGCYWLACAALARTHIHETLSHLELYTASLRHTGYRHAHPICSARWLLALLLAPPRPRPAEAEAFARELLQTCHAVRRHPPPPPPVKFTHPHPHAYEGTGGVYGACAGACM